MKKLLCLLLLSSSIHFSYAQDISAKLDSIVSTYSSLYRFNGTAFVAKNGKVLLDKAYGFRNTADSVRNDPNTIFQLGSITKQFTAAIVLKLEEEHKLSLQDKVSKYFPDFPKGDSITIQNLLTHTAGIYNYTNNREFMDSAVFHPITREKLMAQFKDKPLNFSPGTQWDYSNSGYCLLGYIIEEAAHKPYEQVAREYIFRPLHMDHTGFDFKNLKDKEKSTGYSSISDEGSSPSPSVDSSVSFAAGAMYSTTADLYKWHQAAQQHKILSKADWERAYTPFKNKYGYGWIIDSIAGKRRVAHGGGIHGFITAIQRVPEDDVCIILLDNASDNTVGKIGDNLMAALYDQPYTLPRKKIAISVPETTLQQYVGEYKMKPGFTVSIALKDGSLMARPNQRPFAPLFAEATDLFFLKQADVQIRFIKDEHNKVNNIMVIEGEKETPGERIVDIQ